MQAKLVGRLDAKHTATLLHREQFGFALFSEEAARQRCKRVIHEISQVFLIPLLSLGLGILSII